MPCVGGYVDKEISTAAGYQNKISGGDVHYGNKSIAIISTSDNRFEDGRLFGQYATWVKWAEPTAEALRQACLAKESRISQIEPELPQIFIWSIDVTTSQFLGAFNINFNRQYNAFIGGRGTGKSTILEYLRFGLCDQTANNIIDYEEMSIIEKRRSALIQKTLTEVGGEVRITMERNGVVHIVKRNAKTKEIVLKIGEGEFQQVKEDDIRKLLPIQSYSQKQLSDVGVKTEELKRFIQQPITSQLDGLKFQISETALKLKTFYNQLIRKKEVEQEVENYNLESQSLNTQIETIRKSLKGISPADQEIINKKSHYEIEQVIINNSKNELAVFEIKADELLKLLEQYPEEVDDTIQLENKQLIQNISTELGIKFVEIRAAAKTLKNIFSEERLIIFNTFIHEWNTKKDGFESAYEVAKQNSQSSQQQLHEIQKIERRITEINQLVSDRKSLIKEIGFPEGEYEAQKQNWTRFHSEKMELLNAQAQEFTELSKNLIKAEVTKSINLHPFKAQLKAIFEGTRIREDRIDAIIEHIRVSQNPLSEYTLIINEFRLLAELKVSEGKSLKNPETPILSICG